MMQLTVGSSISSPISLSANDHEFKQCELSTMLSPSSSQLLRSLLLELSSKFEDVDLNSDDCVSYDEFLDVMGEFGATLESTFDEDGYVMIWNKMLMEQMDDTHYDLLYIPFILKYMKPFITTSINSNCNCNYDDILSLTLKLIYDNEMEMEIDCFSEIGTMATFASESYINMDENTSNNIHINIQKAIRELIKLCRCFPSISKGKRYENTERDINDEDYLNLINNLMSVPSYHSSPQVMTMRIRKRKRKGKTKKRAYDLVLDDDDNDDDDNTETNEYEEIDVDEEALNALYEERKIKIFNKYEKDLTMKELTDAYSVALRSVDNDVILRAITVFDCATNQNAPIFMKTDMIRLYLKQRGLTDNETDLAYKCSSAAYHKVTALKLTNITSNTGNETEEQSVSKVLHYKHHYTNNIIAPSPHSAHLTSPFMKQNIHLQRRNSHLVFNELFYPRNHHKKSKKSSRSGISVETKQQRMLSSKHRKQVCYTKAFLIFIALVFLFISTQFGIAQLLSSKLYITPCNGSIHDLKCRQSMNDDILFVDNVDWNYWFKYDDIMIYEYTVPFTSNDWMHLLFFGCFVAICLYWIYFIINVLLDFQCTMQRFSFGVIGFCYSLCCCCCLLIWKNVKKQKKDTTRLNTNHGICWDKLLFKNAYFATTHWFIIMVTTQIVLISTQTVRLLYFGASNLIVFGTKNRNIARKPLYIVIFAVFIGIACVINGSLYLLIIFNYIDINDKRSIIWRERGFISLLIFDIFMDLMFVLTPYLLNIMSINDYDYDIDDVYIQNIGLLHFEGFIDCISTITPMLFLLWHIFDIIKLLEQTFSLDIFSINYELEHAEHLETNQTATNTTLFADNDSLRRRPPSQRSQRQRRNTLSKVSEKESTDAHADNKGNEEHMTRTTDTTYEHIVNAFYEASPSISHVEIQRNDIDIHPFDIDSITRGGAIMAWFDDDKTDRNDENGTGGILDDSGLILSHQHYKTSKKMIRNKHKTTRRLFVCCGVTAVLFVLYGILVMVGIWIKLMDNVSICANPSVSQISQQPNLVVFDKCSHPLYPLYFCRDCIPCECSKFKWSEYEEIVLESQSISAHNVLESVLNDFSMLSIVYIEWYLPISQQNVSLNVVSFASSLAALYLFNVNMGCNILNMVSLEVLSVQYSKWNADCLDTSLMNNNGALRILSISNINLSLMPQSICTLSYLEALDVSATALEDIPLCLTWFDAPLRSLNLLFNALSGELEKELLNRKDLQLLIAPTQLIKQTKNNDDDYTLQYLYLQYNPICDGNETDTDKVYCDVNVMCSPHCLDLFHSDNICDPFCNIQECNYDGADCYDYDKNECRSAMLWFQTIDANANAVIDENEMTKIAWKLIFTDTNSTELQYPMSFTQFVNDVWINTVNCSHIN